MKEYILSELGFRTVSECRKITDAMEGKTFMKFHVNFSNVCGNCMIIISTNYDAVETAVQKVLTAGYRTGDIMSEGCKLVGTKEMGDLIADAIA